VKADANGRLRSCVSLWTFGNPFFAAGFDAACCADTGSRSADLDPGVADLQIYGDREAIFRRGYQSAGNWRAAGLTLVDMTRIALATLPYDVCRAGDLDGSRQSINVRTTATVITRRHSMRLELSPNFVIAMSHA